jgi:ADP-heptose:LPS heptosyltransferase
VTEIPGIQFYSLQKGEVAPSEEKLLQKMNWIDLGNEFEDFSDTAGAIANLDLIISVDTSVVHLAGAMGRNVWALLPFAPDWRWMLHRDDSPWYPTMRLFRQAQRGNWDSVMNHVAAELDLLAHPR